MAGLNIAQHEPGNDVLGGEINRLCPIDPIFNLRPERIEAIRSFFNS